MADDKNKLPNASTYAHRFAMCRKIVRYRQDFHDYQDFGYYQASGRRRTTRRGSPRRRRRIRRGRRAAAIRPEHRRVLETRDVHIG